MPNFVFLPGLFETNNYRDVSERRAGHAVSTTFQVDHHLLRVLVVGDRRPVVDSRAPIVTLGQGIVRQAHQLQQGPRYNWTLYSEYFTL